MFELKVQKIWKVRKREKKREGEPMNKQIGKAKKRIAAAALAMALCLSMVAGAAVSEPAYAFSGYSPFIGNSYSHNARFTNDVVVNGVDVSWWQHNNSDWISAKAAGVDFSIMRASYTGIGSKFKLAEDTRFASHYAKAKSAGIMTGVYHFSQAKTVKEAKKEANYVIARLKALGIGPEDLDLPVYMDYEFNSRLTSRNLSRKTGTAAAKAFCKKIRDAGYQPGIYASLTFFNRFIDMSQIPSDVDIWCAQYYSSCSYGGSYSKWQYTSSGKINGLHSWVGVGKGSIDCNFWYLNPKSEISPRVKVSGVDSSYKYTGSPIEPSVTVKKGSTKLKKGVDYKIGYINNVRAGTGYVYIRGLGNYKGYKMVPFKIKGATASSKKFKKGKYYTVQTELNIRKGPGTQYSQVSRSKLSLSMRKKTFNVKKAVLMPGVKVKCKKVKGDWMKIPGGWICCKYDNELYVY